MNSQTLRAARQTTIMHVAGSDRERLLAVALEEYAAAFERGEPVRKDDLLEKYPDVAADLTGCLDSLDFIHQVAPQIRDDLSLPVPVGGTTADIRPLATLGDFRIIRELGRGGMGVVYEAEQLSLGRRVALKVLPFATMLGDMQLKRFHNEARAAATLEHPNIVSVYSVGVERGVHYYAMQLVDGYNLAQVIAEIHAPHVTSASNIPRGGNSPCENNTVATLSTLRTKHPQEFYRVVAQLVIQAAEALAHAHQQGIIHRDIKPANLLIDGSGKLWVTDFGLARIEADATMTMSGDTLGTLRYMSPEQLSASRAVVDHRTDIYSLGVTLYELLAGQPPFDSTDHRALLNTIAETDPPRLQRLAPLIPIDLSTIVHTAIEKNAADRYLAAQILAEDLKRVVDGCPISARPPDLSQRIVRWLRRNPAIAAAAAMVLGSLFVISTIAAVVIGIAWSDARNAQRKASFQRERFLSERNQALHNLYLADIQLAQQAWVEGHLEPFDELLEAQRPNNGQPDLRGWEWYYLKSLGSREVATLDGHTSDVSCVDWSPDGQLVASSSQDFTIRIWDGVTWHNRATLCGHSADVKCVAWSPNGNRLASSAWDNTLRVWDPSTGNSMLTIPTDFGWMTRNVVWSPDGTRIASCGTSGRSPNVGEGDVKIWDALTGQLVLRMKGPSGLVWAVAWSPDGKLLASTGNGDDPKIRVWDALTGKLVQQFNNRRIGTPITSVSWNPDNARLATTQQEFVGVWTTSTGEIQWEAKAHSGGAAQVRWSPNGNELASVGYDGALKIWSEHGVLEATYRGHRGPVESIAWRSDGRRIASASQDQTVKIWNPAIEQEYKDFDADYVARWLPDARHELAIVSDSDTDESVRLKSLSAGSSISAREISLPLTKTEVHWAGWVELAWSPKRQIAAIAFPTKDALNVTIFETATGTQVGKLEKSWNNRFPPFRDMAWSPAAPLIAVANSDDGVAVWDASSLKQVAEFSKGEGIDALAWNPDGSCLAVSSWDQTMSIYSTANWRRIVRLSRHSDTWEREYGGRRIAAWSPDGLVLAAGSARGWVTMWDTHSWKELLRFSADTASIRSLAFNPDGRRLATASASGVVKIWDAENGENLLILHSGKERPDHISWSSDGTCLLTSQFSHCRVWDASAAMEAETEAAEHK